MRRVIVIILCCWLALQAGAASAKTVIFFIPHQDDEMYMLGSMYREIKAGNDVYAIMVTDGGRSEVRMQLSKTLDHNFTRQEFSTIRNKEFYLVLRAAGFAPNHVIFANAGSLLGSKAPTYLDGDLSFEQATEIIQNAFDTYGDGEYITVLADGGHADHRELHDALFNFIGPSEKVYFAEHTTTGT